jgi:hypothetical protein
MRTKLIEILQVKIDSEVLKLIEDNDLTLGDLGYALCMQLKKVSLCQLPCPLSTLLETCELRGREKSERSL